MKLLFRAAYFMFTSDIPHTTHWRGMLSTIAAYDASGRLTNFLTNCPANVHHLSSTSITSILEAFEVTFETSLRARVEHVTQYAVMADECTDVNRIVKVSICARFI